MIELLRKTSVDTSDSSLPKISLTYLPRFLGVTWRCENPRHPGDVVELDVVWTTSKKWGEGRFGDSPDWKVMRVGFGWVIALRATF
jgi:hypothetical protein